MKRTYNVGSGFGKKSLRDAVQIAKAGDTILINPGVYDLFDKALYIKESIFIKGTGKSPKDVVINGCLNIQHCKNIQISNLSIENLHGTTLNCNDVSLDVSNVYIKGDITNEYYNIFLQSSSVTMKNCEVEKVREQEDIRLIDGSTLCVKDSIITHVDIVQSNLQLYNCQITGSIDLLASRCFGEGFIEFTSSENVLYLDEGSVAKFEYVNLTEEEPIATMRASELVIDEFDEEVRSLYIIQHKNNICNVPENKCYIQRVEPSEEQVTQANQSNQNINNEYSNDNYQDDDYEEDDYEDDYYDEDYDSDVEYDERDYEEKSISGRKQLDQLIGLNEVKKELNAFINTVSFNEQRRRSGLAQTDFVFHSMFLGNPGTGKTTVARILQDLLYEEGIIKTHKFIEVDRSDLVTSAIGGTADKTKEVLDSALGGILFIDEAYTLYSESEMDYGKEAFDTIMKYMEDHRNDIIVIFAGYADKMQNLINMNSGFSSRVPHVFHFEDYSPSEISEIGYRDLLSKQYSVNESRYKQIMENRYRVSADKSNARWIRNQNEELIKTMITRVAASNIDGADVTQILDEDLDAFIGGNAESREEKVNELLEQLNGLIGLNNVKKLVTNIIKKAKADQKLSQIDPSITKPAYNMVFSGNPGTGKTTVAKLVGEIFYNLGILSSNIVKVVERSDLVGKYIGHTEANTKKAIEEAMGGVLFVDEAYQLSSREGNDFGKQAIETLLTAMENYRENMIFIFAGYTNEMEQFLDTNPGLRSRIQINIEFDDYSSHEVAQIVDSILSKSWSYEKGTLFNTVEKIYEILPINQKANGRSARNIAEDIISAQKVAIVDNDLFGEDMKNISTEVFSNVLNEYSIRY